MAFSRRDFLRLAGSGAAAVVSGPLLTRAATPGGGKAKRPNILWLSCEDISPHLGCYARAGENWLGLPRTGKSHTPTLDRLAAEGCLFRRAFSHSGVCAPTRSGIITGMYPVTLGTHHMRCRRIPPPHVKCFPEYLRRAGYYCTNNVKTDYNFPVPRSAWDECSRRAHWKNRKAGQPFFAVFNDTGTHEGRIRSSRRATTSGRGFDPAKVKLPPYYPDTPAVRKDWARYLDLIGELDGRVAKRLKEIEGAGLADSTIVFFWADHGVGLPRAKRWLYDSGIHVPLIVYVPPAVAEARPQAARPRPGTIRGDLVAFVDLAPTVLSLAGVKVPKHMQGQVFLGAEQAPPRKYVYGARDRMDERYDIIRAVRDKRYKYIRNFEPFKSYDQYMNTPEGGSTLREIRRLGGTIRPFTRPQAWGTQPEPQPPRSVEGVPLWVRRFARERKPVEELYDLQADPHEMRNLLEPGRSIGPPSRAELAETREVLARMRKALRAWQIRVNDRGLVPESMLDEPDPAVGKKVPPVEAKYANTVYLGKKMGDWAAELTQENRVVRLMAAVALSEAGLLDERALSQVCGHPDPAVRYWFATNLGNRALVVLTRVDEKGEFRRRLRTSTDARVLGQAREAQRQAKVALPRLLKDPAPGVRVMAARGMVALGSRKEAIPVLVEALKHPNEAIRIRAADVLDGIGPNAAPASAALERALKNDRSKYVRRIAHHALNALKGKPEKPM